MYQTRHVVTRAGWSFVEVMVVLTIVGILTALCVPSYRRALEQSRADIAAANLRAVWSAERVYWLEHHHYTASFAELAPLLDPSIATSTTTYVYSLDATDGSTF